MVSDVLVEAVDGLNRYLKEPTFRNVYAGKTRKRIETLIADMEALRVELDTLPQKK